jgi:cytochrome c-type biogenesis protein CcmF
MFWNMVLGLALLFTVKQNRQAVLAVFSVVQVFLASMMLGIFIGDWKIGSTPFLLLRDSGVLDNAPILRGEDGNLVLNYLAFIKDGNGLNPLLQNYWMVIHPPVLFLGFASTLIPFALALGSLLKKDFTTWTVATLPWALFGCAVLGAGIMMGGAWAYESLTFGGYWAWDPVENASLVPWLLLIAGVHTNLVFQKTGRSLHATYIFYFLTFFLILYSTFLTRSGILGETSVHAFTDLGMSGQLLIYMSALSLPAIVLLIVYWRRIPAIKKEEELFTREFWIFIGSLLFLVSAIQITITTSIPVWNKILGTEFAPPTDAISHYNKFQLPVAVLILLISSAALYLKFRKSDKKAFARRAGIIAIISVAATIAIALADQWQNWNQIILLFASLFGVLASGYYMWIVFRGRKRLHGAAVAHFGFALMLLGILISSGKKEPLTYNHTMQNFGEGSRLAGGEHNMRLDKNLPLPVGKYLVTYLGDSVQAENTYYKVLYEKFEEGKQEAVERFYLFPNAQINPKMGLIANPDTRHRLHYDLYTHVTAVPDRRKMEESAIDTFRYNMVKAGDTLFTSKAFVIFENLNRVEQSDRFVIAEGDLAIEANLLIQMMDGKKFSANPIFFVHSNRVSFIDDPLPELGLTFRLQNINPETAEVSIGISEVPPKTDYIVMQAIIFPLINLLWLGLLITTLGFFISIFRIIQKKRKTNAGN